MQGPLLSRAKAVAYVALNIVSGTSIVFLNKVVFSVFGFSYIYALAFIHAAVTAVGMWGFGWCGVFEPKRLPLQSMIPLAGSFLGYIVCWNLSLRVNPVGFYQLSKIMITPTVVALEILVSSKWPSKAEQAAIATLCAGVSLATVTDPNLEANASGLVIGAAAVLFAAVYQVWAGSKQRELGANSMQLMHQYCPWAALFLGIMVPLVEPVGWHPAGTVAPQDSLLGFPYTVASTVTIGATAVLGLLVSLSTLLVIGATSSVTFNVLGHSKTVLIIVGGVTMFGEGMPVKKLCGVLLALAGIGWYSWLRLSAANAAQTPPSPPELKPLLSSPSREPTELTKSPSLSKQASIEAKASKV